MTLVLRDLYLLGKVKRVFCNQEFWFRARKQFVSGVYIGVHEDHEQIFDDVLGQKATVTKDLYHKNRNFLWFRKLHLCLPFMTDRGERGSGTDSNWDNETRRKRKREAR